MLGNQPMSLTDERMNKEDVVHIYNKVLSRHKDTKLQELKKMDVIGICHV